jgi:hypothetical protein
MRLLIYVHWGTPVILLEGSILIKTILGLMEYRNDIGFISKGRWEKEVPIQYCY